MYVTSPLALALTGFRWCRIIVLFSCGKLTADSDSDLAMVFSIGHKYFFLIFWLGLSAAVQAQFFAVTVTTE